MRPLPSPPVHEQKSASDLRAHPRRPQHKELMLPFDVAPRLGRQQILRVLDVADTARVNLIPTEALVGASNVRLELAARHRRTIVRTRKARTQDERCGTEPLSDRKSTRLNS